MTCQSLACTTTFHDNCMFSANLVRWLICKRCRYGKTRPIPSISYWLQVEQRAKTCLSCDNSAERINTVGFVFFWFILEYCTRCRILILRWLGKGPFNCHKKKSVNFHCATASFVLRRNDRNCWCVKLAKSNCTYVK